jgi:hypothetical protein
MAASDVSSNVEALSPYTIGVGGTISVSVFNTMYALAEDQTDRDNAGSVFTTEELYEAQALLVCHYIARRQGMSGKISESGIGTYGYSRGANAGLTVWLDEYNALLANAQANGSVTAEDLLGSSGGGYNHIDSSKSKDFSLDQQPETGQVYNDTPDSEGSEAFFYGGS